MSERGSFVTSYIYCTNCFNVAKRILFKNGKYFKSQVLDSWIEGESLPIIAGKIGGLYSGEEIHYIENELIPLIEREICHEIRIAVLCDNFKYNKILKIKGNKGGK